eukprot:1182963-Prorocentrum_minimum.AAC.2
MQVDTIFQLIPAHLRGGVERLGRQQILLGGGEIRKERPRLAPEKVRGGPRLSPNQTARFPPSANQTVRFPPSANRTARIPPSADRTVRIPLSANRKADIGLPVLQPLAGRVQLVRQFQLLAAQRRGHDGRVANETSSSAHGLSIRGRPPTQAPHVDLTQYTVV